ncbi:hypothetical protein [Fodinibius saliphilus]|uniref:hypothetical protein n=1 Tax=Fodinibius saliphilus TaxID=1920650 RepID=UPI001108B1F5|nr:hypothetical protein [Fodinibius saliphilus]
MKVQDFKTDIISGRKRVSANIIWEDTPRPSEEVYFEVDEQFANDISCNPNAFFLATVIPALHYGEHRFFIEEKISPVLYQGAKDTLGWFYHWFYKDKRDPLKLEVETKAQATSLYKKGKSACFLSGGVDSYHTLFENWSIYSKTHPRYITHGVVAYGLEQDDPKKFEYVLSFLQQVADDLNISLIPVYTNIYLIHREEDAKNSFDFWISKFQGAALASIAHILSNRLNSISIAGTYDLVHQVPDGLHPSILPNFSSEKLNIRLDGILYSRLTKTKKMLEASPLPISLRVCNRYKKYEYGNLNCGKCEKCIRTMLAFMAIGKLHEIDSFPTDNITAEMIYKNVAITSEYTAACYNELIAPLEEQNHNELANALRYKLNLYYNKDKKLKSKFIKLNHKIHDHKLTYMLKS